MKLQRLLQKLEDLDMTDKIKILRRQNCGGCADIYIGQVIGSLRRVAIKRARFSGAGDMITFVKVRLHHYYEI